MIKYLIDKTPPVKQTVATVLINYIGAMLLLLDVIVILEKLDAKLEAQGLPDIPDWAWAMYAMFLLGANLFYYYLWNVTDRLQ